MTRRENACATEPGAISQAVESWFVRVARDLPWRNPRTPWRALVSELMLQQTQVSRVIDRFEPFMKRFPTPEALARADEQDVLALWQGLGYYRRARHLHGAAKEIVSRFGGEVPLDAASLRTLPGVGRYTAGSIASIVGGHREAIVDGNVARVLARVYIDDGSPDDKAFASRAWSRAEALVQACDEPGLLNEGLMELGATICTPAPGTPVCGECPLGQFCGARRTGRVSEIPQAKQAARASILHQHAVVLKRRGRVLLQRRDVDGLWGGMWQVPTVEGPRQLADAAVVKALDVPVELVTATGAFTRRLTHRVVHVHAYQGTLARGSRVPASETCRWVAASELAAMPLSTAARQVLTIARAETRP